MYVGVFPDGVLFFNQFLGAAESFSHFPICRVGAKDYVALGEIGDRHAAGLGDVDGIRLDLAADHLQECAFAGTVGAAQGGT
jgi:hypothetical protein